MLRPPLLTFVRVHASGSLARPPSRSSTGARSLLPPTRSLRRRPPPTSKSMGIRTLRRRSASSQSARRPERWTTRRPRAKCARTTKPTTPRASLRASPTAASLASRYDHCPLSPLSPTPSQPHPHSNATPLCLPLFPHPLPLSELASRSETSTAASSAPTPTTTRSSTTSLHSTRVSRSFRPALSTVPMRPHACKPPRRSSSTCASPTRNPHLPASPPSDRQLSLSDCTLRRLFPPAPSPPFPLPSASGRAKQIGTAILPPAPSKPKPSISRHLPLSHPAPTLIPLAQARRRRRLLRSKRALLSVRTPLSTRRRSRARFVRVASCGSSAAH